MASSSQAGKRRGKTARAAHGSPIATKRTRSTRGALGPNRKRVATMGVDDQKFPMRQGSVAPRAEPSTEGAKQWTGGRRQMRKHR